MTNRKHYPPMMVGNVYNSWTVITLDDGQHKGKVLCRCVCGAQRWVSKYNLNTGMSKSCGCQRTPTQYDSDKSGAEYVQPMSDDFYSKDFDKLVNHICKKYGLLKNGTNTNRLLLDGLMLLAAKQSGVKIAKHTCVDCGCEFIGGLRKSRCPFCDLARTRKIFRANHYKKQAGIPTEQIGVTKRKCILCGKEYIIENWNQKYCPECKKEGDKIRNKNRDKKGPR